MTGKFEKTGQRLHEDEEERRSVKLSAKDLASWRHLASAMTSPGPGKARPAGGQYSGCRADEAEAFISAIVSRS